jgi:hypothetical protein
VVFQRAIGWLAGWKLEIYFSKNLIDANRFHGVICYIVCSETPWYSDIEEFGKIPSNSRVGGAA